MSVNLASHCNLHSYASSTDAAPGESSAPSYSTSLSTDTLFWESQSEASTNEPRNNSVKAPNPNHRQHQQYIRYHPHPAQVQPIPSSSYQQHYVQKPKSWDNLTTRSFGGYGFGYGYLDTVVPKHTVVTKPQPTNIANLQTQSMPRKNTCTRYTVYTDFENYAPPPPHFVQHQMTTMTTTVTTKSTENLIVGQNNSDSNLSCECLSSASNLTPISRGYYSNLPKNNVNYSNRSVATTTEITRL